MKLKPNVDITREDFEQAFMSKFDYTELEADVAYYYFTNNVTVSHCARKFETSAYNVDKIITYVGIKRKKKTFRQLSVEEIKKHIEMGKTYQQIAWAMDTTPTTIRRALKEGEEDEQTI